MFRDGDPELMHGLPLSEACLQRKVMVKMPPDSGVDSMLYWAVDMIIGYLVEDEKKARVDFVNERRRSAKKAHDRGLALQAMTG